MLRNLVVEKINRKLTNQQMADIAHISRPAYEKKVRNETFTLSECKRYIDYFDSTFEYLFATNCDYDSKKE